MSNKVVINLMTGLEDPERVTVAFLVAVSAVDKGRPVRMFLTKEAVHLALAGGTAGAACEGFPALAELADRFAAGGGQLQVCPACFNSRALDPATLLSHAEVTGAMPLFDWIGDEAATVFSY